MGPRHILLVEDEEDIQQLIEYNLLKRGYKVTCASTGEEGLRFGLRESPDLVILDLMLPSMDGLEVCRRLKRDRVTQEIPVIILTAKGEEADILAGFDAGADDYVTKPFSPKVLLARVSVALRRGAHPKARKDAELKVQGLQIDPKRHEVMLGDEKIDLTLTEFRLLYLLASRPGWVFSRTQIVQAVHGEDYPVTDRSVDVHVTALRRKLGKASAYLETVRGVGYRIKD